MSEQICDAFINISSDKKQCHLLKGHSGFHRMGQLEWNWPGQPDQATDKPPVASAEGKLPELDVTQEERDAAREWCGMLENHRRLDGLIEVDSNFRCRERQLLAAREEIAELKDELRKKNKK